MAFSRMLRRVVLVGTDISEEFSASIMRVTRLGELRTLAATSNRRTLRRYFFAAPPKRRFLQEPHGVTSQKTAFFKRFLCYIHFSFRMISCSTPFHPGSIVRVTIEPDIKLALFWTLNSERGGALLPFSASCVIQRVSFSNTGHKIVRVNIGDIQNTCSVSASRQCFM
jgi:hypothetical protein